MNTTYINDTQAVEALLADVNGRRGNIVSLADITKAVTAAEATLTTFGVRKADWKDVEITINPERNRQPSANSYKYRAQATEVVVARNSTGWFIKSAKVAGALSPTVANRRDFFITAPHELISFAAMKTALGIATV